MNDQFQTAGEIAAELSTVLATITKANGYETDIGTRVFRGARKVQDEQVPCAVLVEGADRVTQGKSVREATAKIEQDYILGGYSPCDPNNPNDEAHKIIRDLKRALFGGGKGTTLGGKVPEIAYNGRDIGPRTDGLPIVFAIIEITVTYVERLATP